MHGVDTDVYAPPADRAAVFAEAGLPGRYAIGCFGRVRAQKGTDVFVDAMCRLLPRYPDFTAVMVGAITPEQQRVRERAEEADRGRGPAIAHRHHRRTCDRGCAALVPAADDLCFHLAQRRFWPDADRGDGGGGGAGGLARGRGELVVEDGVTGMLMPTGDVEALVAALEPLMRDPAAAAAMGERGAARVVEKFSLDAEANAIADVYRTLV